MFAALSVRIRLLILGLVPSVTMLVVGSVLAAGSVRDSARIDAWAADLELIRPAAVELMQAVQDERALSLRRIATRAPVAELAAARARVDRGFTELVAVNDRRHTPAPAVAEQRGGFETGIARLRQAIDANAIGAADAYALFNAPYSLFLQGFRAAQRNSPDTELAVRIAEALRLIAAVEALSRTGAVLTAMAGSGLAFPETELTGQAGYYRIEIAHLAVDASEPQRQLVAELIATPEWDRLEVAENALRAAAAEDDDRAADGRAALAEWESAAAPVRQQLITAYTRHHDAALGFAAAAAARAMRTGLGIGALAVVASVVTFAVSLVLAGRFSRRFRRLRAALDEVVGGRLDPALRDADAGDRVPVVATAAIGSDEIGEIAAAFDHATQAAIGAAAQQARTRAGLRAVFVSIARRSQTVVHRQLELLDEAERAQQDPQLLDTFFRLDHLVTRERRNAEQLLVLGGAEAGRRWTRPVALSDLARSAAGEIEEYTRVRIAALPAIAVHGGVVADLIHAIAELLDNATTFSPPGTRVDLTARRDGDRVLVDISDQGIGMDAEELAAANELLAAPPDFRVESLMTTSRLGFFVVAYLTGAHGVRVHLSESDYGGVRAVVAIPDALVADPAGAGATGR